MNLTEQISQDLKIALKAKNLERVKVLRYLISQLKYAALDAKKSDLTDEEAQKVIGSLVKKTKESREMFVQAKRDDKTGEADAELAILNSYLPQQLSPENLEKEIEIILKQAPENLAGGALVGYCIKKLAGRAESAQIAQIVNRLAH